jgi:hypothetical protein
LVNNYKINAQHRRFLRNDKPIILRERNERVGLDVHACV